MKVNIPIAFFLYLLTVPAVFAQVGDERIAHFWKFVADNERKYYENQTATQDDWNAINAEVAKINGNVSVVVLTEPIGGKRRLVITTGGNKEYFSLAGKIVRAAPFMKLLLPVALFPRLEKTTPFSIAGVQLSILDVKVHFDKPVKGRYQLFFILPAEHNERITSAKSGNLYGAYMNTLYIMTMQALGEKMMSEKIDKGEMLPLNMVMPSIPLSDLYDAIK